MSVKECCICFEYQNHKQFYFICDCCKSGLICRDCIGNFDPCGSPWEYGLNKIKKIISCPICRTHNWKYHYSLIISDMCSTLLESYNQSKVAYIYEKNCIEQGWLEPRT
jgi:hypothetical protein